MQKLNALSDLISKVQSGVSSPEEELHLLRYLNDSAKLMLMVINEVKVEQLTRAIKNGSQPA